MSEKIHGADHEQMKAKLRQAFARTSSSGQSRSFSKVFSKALSDPLMLDAVLAQTGIREVGQPAVSLDSHPTVLVRGGVPVLYLAAGVRVFEYA